MTLTFSGRWIPVTERLPDDDITVMLHQPDTSDPWILGCRDGEDWRTQDGCWIIYGVTHWADLPAGPVVNQSLTTEHPAGVKMGDTDQQREDRAREIYNGWRDQKGWVPWVEGGNSLMQDEARREAAAGVKGDK